MERPRRSLAVTRKALLLLLALPAVVLVSNAGVAVFRAQRSLIRAAQSAATEGRLPYSLQAWQPAGTSLLFEPVASAPSYATATFFEGNFYLAGPAGVTISRPDGATLHILRAGIELPAAPIVAIASGRLRGSSEPQVLLATDGAGVLMLQSNGKGAPVVMQLLPAGSGLRNLSAILPLATGDLLLGTREKGVLIYDGSALTPLAFRLDGVNSSAMQVTALAAVDAASFLVGTRNDGVFYAHAGTVEHAAAASGLPDDQVETILVTEHRAYVGTPLGTAAFELTGSAFRVAGVLGQGIFSQALAIEDGQLWIGTMDEGVEKIPLELHARLRRASIAVPLVPSGSAQRIESFVNGPDGLYALADGVLVRRGRASWTPSPGSAENVLSDRNLSALAFAPDGSLYVGFFDHGIDILSPDGTSIQHLEDDHLFCINRLALDPQRHTMAAATANGLVLFDEQGRPRQTLTRRDGLISDHVTDVAFLGDGTALATPAGITFLTSSGAESLYAFQGLVNNHVYALASGQQGQLLAGTLGGLSILQSRAVQRNFTVTNSGLKHNWITALLAMDGGNFLVGTYGAGLEMLDRQGRFNPVELPAGAPRDLVINPNALYATPSHLYAGTLGHGLLAYSMRTGRWSALTQGLPSLNVTAFAARGGELYIGTENGLVRIAEASLP